MKDGKNRSILLVAFLAFLLLVTLLPVSPAYAVLEWEEMSIPNSGVNCTFSAAMAFKDHLYLGENPGIRIFQTSDGSTLTQVIPDKFGNPDNTFIRIFFIFGQHLYAAVSNNVADNTQLWRTFNGTSWELASTHTGHILTTHGAAIHKWPIIHAVFFRRW
ncbi:MAG: hypothetical protein JRJ85_15250 [Deltaproteobacteria bacterium]|nr:hypothetical protein [Deltaproteobacteria bacterium]